MSTNHGGALSMEVPKKEENLTRVLKPVHLWALAVGLVISGNYFGWSYGFAAGGSDLPTKSPNNLFGGGSGAGINVTPVAFLVIS